MSIRAVFQWSNWQTFPAHLTFSWFNTEFPLILCISVKFPKIVQQKKCCCIGNIDFVEGILQWCSWQSSFKHPYSKICFSSHSMQSCEIFLFEHKMTSTSHSSTCVVDTSFNDAVDELFQHTLTAHMLIGTFRFVIDKKFHVWIYWSWWIFEKHEISAFCTASCGRDPSVMQLTSSSSPPWFKSLLFLLLHLQLWNLLIWKKTSVYSFTWFIERSFNDAVDELFQHTLTTHMLSGTFRFSIYTIFHVWIQCIDYNDFLKNMIFHYFA